MSTTFALMVSILVSAGATTGSPLQLEPQVRKGFVIYPSIASAREMQSQFSQVYLFTEGIYRRNG